ncbi:hypothetical protein PF005_g7002 [Phytophthora fragariae]|uniref:Uncharacterized protein n=3 Tax=Phytophthora fragariae TaxID=53985 RepID=A0A6A3ZRS7_9STRA|nr:hypothetical protein PF005_g7002 [Phytophthora fragariae]KAE9239595.1 hypothetical protein PF002_g10197 [Phytophthora fragariae]
MSSPSSSGPPSRSPPTGANADELRHLNALLRGRLAHANAELQRVASSRNVTADEQHRLSRTLLRQTHELRVLEDLYRARQEEIWRLRAEIAAFQEPEDPDARVDPRVVGLESRLRQQEADFRNLEARFDHAVSERDVLQDQGDHLAEEMWLAGDEIEQLQEDRNDLDRTRENAEHELLLTETSLARATEALQQAESRVAELEASASEAAPTPNRLTQERDDAQAAAAHAGDQMGAMEEDLQAFQRLYYGSSADLNRLRAVHAVSTDDLIQTVRDRDTARADADRLRGDLSDRAELAAAKTSREAPAKQLAESARRLRDMEHSTRVLLRERDVARSARDQIRQERDALQQDLDAARQKLTAVAAAVGTPPAVDGDTSGPAAVLHSLRSTPVGPSAQDLPADLQDRASSGPDAATSPPSSKRPRSPPASPESSPAPLPSVGRLPSPQTMTTTMDPSHRSGSSPVDLTQDDGHLANDDRGASDVSDADSDAGSGYQGSVGSVGKEDSDAKSSSDEEEDEDTAEVANDLLEAQTLQALAQSRSAERRRRQASPRRGSKGNCAFRGVLKRMP